MEGSGGKQGGGQRNNFLNNKQPNKNPDSRTSNLEELEAATYILSHFSPADQYEKATKNIIRDVIRKMPGGVHLPREMRNFKQPNMSLDPNPKQYKNPDGTSAVDNDKYELQVLEWKENKNIQIERKRNLNEGNHKLYAVLIDQSLLSMRSKL